jgi:hypothetical protein
LGELERAEEEPGGSYHRYTIPKIRLKGLKIKNEEPYSRKLVFRRHIKLAVRGLSAILLNILCEPTEFWNFK